MKKQNKKKFLEKNDFFNINESIVEISGLSYYLSMIRACLGITSILKSTLGPKSRTKLIMGKNLIIYIIYYYLLLFLN